MNRFISLSCSTSAPDRGGSPTRLPRAAWSSALWRWIASWLVLLGAVRTFAVDGIDPAATLAGEQPSARFTAYRLSESEIALEWSGPAVLQSAASLAGPWETMLEATSPFQATRADVHRFYRLAASGVRSVQAVDATTLRVTYDRPVNLSALNAANYSVRSLEGSPLGVMGAKFGATDRIVDLSTAAQSLATYELTINNVQDNAGQPVYFQGRVFSGNPKGAVVSAAASTSTRVIVAFNEPMADNALAPQHYLIKDPAGATLAVTDADFDGPLTMVVALTTAPQANVLYTVTVTNITDLGGDPIATRTATFQGRTAIGLVRAIATDSTHLVLTFSGPVGDSALAPSSYQLEQLDAANTVVGPLGIVSAAFAGEQNTLIELTTAPQRSARYRITSTAGLTDRAGSVLPPVSWLLDGIAGQPALALVASTRPTSVLVTFSVPMSDDVLSPAAYGISRLDDLSRTLPVLSARFVGSEQRVVELITAPQEGANYVIRRLDATNTRGTPLVLPSVPGVNLFTGNASPSGTPAEGAAPRVVGAASLATNQVIVAFSEPMASSAIRPEHYVIVQENVNPEAAYLRVYAAEFYQQNPSTVLLTTSPQNELTYRVTVVNATDLSGVALAPKLVSNGVLVDPTSALFPGTPPVGSFDSDGDGLADNVETRGWIVTVVGADGAVRTRGVTSDPAVADTDGDGLNDAQEANLRFDPRNVDTDDDQLNDYAEFNEIYSNGLAQDTDADGLDDFLEFTFFHTSPLFADTDGDQIKDGDEIFGNRNPRVSDLPRPEISVGEVNLQLNVQFTESNAEERRNLETQSVTSTLSASERQTFTRQDTVNMELHFDVGTKDGVAATGWENVYARGGFSVGYTFQQTDESEVQTQKAYERSLSTDKEVTKGFTVQRQVLGAVMQIGVNLRNLSSLAYRVRNLQVTAFIQDPQDHSRLTPVATLLPDKEPEEGYTLGPLASDRGPFIFSNATIVPTLVEALMANSSGLIFRISNYDIIDERGRNFAFSGQEIIERTSRLVIDFGGASSLRALVSGEAFDEIQPGDETEIHRVATSAGRAIADTNGDGQVDRPPHEIFNSQGDFLGLDLNGDGALDAADDAHDPDTVVVFDGAGKEVGITLHQAMAAIGLVRYDEATTPTVNLTDEEILGSYSTIRVNGREKVFRIRGISNDAFNRKFWEILTPLGVDQVTDLNDLILKSSTPVSLNFVQDLDGDGLTADVEFFLRTSDSDLPVSNVDPSPRGRDTDKDGLDDRFEALIGWTVTTPQRTYKVWSSPNRKDSNFDDPAVDPQNLYDGSDAFAAPAGWNDLNNNHLRDRLNEVFQTGPEDYVLDPIRKDTDGDGINDADEIVGFSITRITDGSQIFRGPNPVSGLRPNPLNPDTDGDTFSDGFERQVGLDPTDPEDIDSDGDGLPDPVEDVGWAVTTMAVSGVGFQQGQATTVTRTSNKFSVDSDEDGLTDFEEFFLKTNALDADTDGDGISDVLELRGYTLPHKVGGDDLGILRTLVLDADTDNDKRSDGDEAELTSVELARWIVRVDGQTPYRAFSNPLIADADFDFVVDGDEFNFDPFHPTRHTDPNNGDTDGDGRDDGIEIGAQTNPLAVDLRVTVIAESVETSAPGQYNFGLYVRPPDPAGVAGLGRTNVVFESLTATANRLGLVRVHNTGAYVAKISYRWFFPGGAEQSTGEEGDLLAGQTVDYNPGARGVPNGATFYPVMRAVAGNTVAASERFTFASGSLAAAKYTSGGTTLINTSFNLNGIEAPVDNPQNVPFANRSVSFGLAKGQRFSIQGFVTGFTTAATETVQLGGLEGEKAFQESSSGTPTEIRPVLSWIQVADKFLEEFYFEGTVNGATVKIRFYYLIE